MNVTAQFFQSFLVLYAKTLFFIDNQQAETFKPDTIGEQRMGSDNNVQRALFQAPAGLCQFFVANQS